MTASTPTIDVLVVGPGRELRVERVAADFREFNRLVGGPIASMLLPPELRAKGLHAYCDDEALIRTDTPPPNYFMTHLGHARLHGPIVIFGNDGMGNEVSLSAKQVRRLERYFNEPPTEEALHTARLDAAFWVGHPSGHAIYTLNDDLSLGEEIPLPANE